MLLALDVGNTNIVLGVYDRPEAGQPAKLIADWRVTTILHRTVDEMSVLLRELFELRDLKIEDVTGASARPGDHIVGSSENAFNRAEQQCRIEVSLNTAIKSDPLPCFVKRGAPICSDDVAAGIS